MVKHLPTIRDTWVHPWVRKISWRRKWQPTPVFLPGKSHGWRSPVGYSLWGHKELNTTERLHTHFLLTIYFTLHSLISMVSEELSTALISGLFFQRRKDLWIFSLSLILHTLKIRCPGAVFLACIPLDVL